MKKILSLFLILVSLTSCLGIYYDIDSSENKELERKNFILLKGKNNIDNSCEEIEYRKSDLIKLWGEPKEIIKKENTDEWIYKKGVNFSGIIITVAVVIQIPIPLVVPVGKYDTKLVFDKNDKLINIFYEEDKHINGYGIIVVPYFYVGNTKDIICY